MHTVHIAIMGAPYNFANIRLLLKVGNLRQNNPTCSEREHSKDCSEKSKVLMFSKFNDNV